MRNAVLIASEEGGLLDAPGQAASVDALDAENEVAANGAPTEQAMVQLKHCAKHLVSCSQPTAK